MNKGTTKLDMVKKLAIQGKTLDEIVQTVDSTPGAVCCMMNRLRKEPNFHIKFTSAGKSIDSLKQSMLDTYHAFRAMHGFLPKQTWIARVFNCSRQHASKSQPSIKGIATQFDRLQNIEVPKDFSTFAKNYSELFDITQAEAIKSILYNINWSGVNFRGIRLEQQKMEEELLEK